MRFLTGRTFWSHFCGAGAIYRSDAALDMYAEPHNMKNGCSITSQQVAIAGYPNMGNITVGAGKQLLLLLAEDSDTGDEFRRFLVGQSTTYFGESDNWWVTKAATLRR